MKNPTKVLVFAATVLVANSSLLLAQTIVAEIPAGGGPIAIVASGDFRHPGLTFHSASGGLVPVSVLGGQNASGDPFTLLTVNTRNQVTYEGLGSPVEFADGSCTVLSVGAKAGADDIQLLWAPFASNTAPVIVKDSTCAEAVPEPSTLELIGMSMITLCVARRILSGGRRQSAL